MKKIVNIRNLDCAACAAELSEELMQIGGVKEATADFINQRVTLVLSDEGSEEIYEKCVRVITGFEDVELADGTPPKERHIKEIVSISASACCFAAGLGVQIASVSYWAAFALFLASALAAGWTVLIGVAKAACRAFKGGFHPLVLLDENLLMTLASIGAFAIGEFLEGAAVMLLYQIGELLQNVAVGSSRGEIARLAALRTASALRMTEGGEEEISPEELAAGDVILLRKGDRTPADVRLLEGETAFDTKSLTGEAYLKEAAAGAEVLAGCVNEGNAVKAEVLRPASESAVAKILDLVENSASQKAKPEKFITRFARIYTPVVVLLAVLVAVVPPLFEGYNFAKWLVPAIEFLVISCPCALIISVPLTYFAGVGTLARHGVLAKGAVYLDELAKVKVAAFDKTGTLTEGKFTVLSSEGENTLALAAAVEKNSSHPLAQAFRGIETPFAAEDPEEIAGMGLVAAVEGEKVAVGSARLMEKLGIEVPEKDKKEGSVLTVYVARGGKYVGKAEIEDRVREGAADALSGLKAVGVETLAVLTGDTKERAERSLKGLPVDVIEAGLMPEEKPKRAAALKEKGPLLYVGDGINDTPMMAESDVSVAMGGLGSDAAIEASDFVLAGDDLKSLPRAVKGAKKTRKIVLQNIVFSVAVKMALMAASLAATATAAFALPIWAAVFGDVGVMLLAVCNSLRMRGRIK